MYGIDAIVVVVGSAAVTIKIPVTPIPPAVDTKIGPTAVAGTVTISCVVVALITLAIALPNVTVLPVAIALKLVPVMVTSVPSAPEVGVKLVIVGAVPAGAGTVKLVPE